MDCTVLFKTGSALGHMVMVTAAFYVNGTGKLKEKGNVSGCQSE
jgi:hypothetical protein